MQEALSVLRTGVVQEEKRFNKIRLLGLGFIRK
jgi:hypothetical protein